MNQGLENASQAVRTAAGGAEQVIQQGKEQLKGAYQSASTAATNVVQQSKDLLEDSYHTAASTAENAIQWSRACVQRNPLLAAFGTLGIGFAIGFLASWQRPTLQTRLAQDPMNVLREALQSLARR